MKIICVLFMAVILTNCSQVEKKIDKTWWDPVKGMFRVTYGIAK